MPTQFSRVTVESLDRFRANLQSLVAEKTKSLPSLRYCDLRIQVREQKSAVAENGSDKASSEDCTFDFGVRAIAGERSSASGYYGRVLGTTDLDQLEDVIWDSIKQAHNGLAPMPDINRELAIDFPYWAAA